MAALRPSDEGALAELVRGCRSAGRKLRVHGARHSVSPAIGTGERDGAEVTLAALSEIRFESDSRVTVGAGCRMHQDPLARDASACGPSLAAALERRGRALCSVGGVMHQTLAGFLATGSAGGSFQHNLHAKVKRVRLVDGCGRARELCAGDPQFELAGVSLGLLGAITEIELETDPHFDVIGHEQTVERANAPFDLLGTAEHGVWRFLEQHEYARVFWFPQPGVQKFILWSASRATAADYDEHTGPPSAFTPKPYRALPTLVGSDRPVQALAAAALRLIDRVPNPWLTRTLIEAFLPAGRQRFWDSWHRGLAMDDSVSERYLPFEFAELWFKREDATIALARLDAFFARYQLRATANFAVELYAGPANPFALGPGHREPCLRVNVLHPGGNRQAAAARFAALWDLFADMAPQLHWGKHLPPPPRAASWIEHAWPRLPEFLALREELDPDGVFLSSYFRQRLGIAERRARQQPVAVRLCAAQPSRAAVALGAEHASRSSSSAQPRHLASVAAATERPADDAMVHSSAKPAPHQAHDRVWLRWPLAFDLEPVGLEFGAQATRLLEFEAVSAADPETLFDAFVHMEHGRAWLEQFWAVERDPDQPDSVFDEHFSFMRLRLRTLQLQRPWSWIARIEASSIPLATRLLERLDLERTGDGRTRVTWRLYFDPHPLAAPFERQLMPIFEQLYGRSLKQLGVYCELQSGIARS